MELMQLEMFVAVVEESSVRRAAKRVFRTQPAVSIALGKLQEEIGALLFEDTRRTNRKLTEAGEILYE
jgi:DNA-binding transcriptional LysR family regulator